MNLINFMAAVPKCYPELQKIFDIVNKVLGVIMIAVPILIILFGTIDLLKAVIAQKDDEMKKAWSTLLKRLIYGVAVFLLSVIVMFVLNQIGGAGVTNCLK